MTLLGIWKPYFTQRFFITLNINILCKLQHSEWCGSLVFLLFLIKDLNFKPKRRLPCFSSITRFSRRPHSLEWKSSCIACSQCWISSDTRGGCRDLPHVSYENDEDQKTLRGMAARRFSCILWRLCWGDGRRSGCISLARGSVGHKRLCIPGQIHLCQCYLFRGQPETRRESLCINSSAVLLCDCAAGTGEFGS